ncbi:ABC transporter permease [Psychrobacter sp. I-STPA10]|uniref:ABC transporter permease n=1 Tax=Psychrobacter sp. I-STPA10 TaxID=2585769 RepID=UPI001E5357D5|nr:FtsX-like permease family protein [Psychrobacter sp. I-STPA10]
MSTPDNHSLDKPSLNNHSQNQPPLKNHAQNKPFVKKKTFADAWLPGSLLGNKAVRRSWVQHWIYPLLFLLAMILSLSTYLTLDSIQQSVDDYVADNQRALVGGDLVLTSQQTWSEPVLSAVREFEPDKVVYESQFNAMITGQEKTTKVVQEADNSQNLLSLLARVKAVSPAYPLYGEVKLASGKALSEQLKSHQVVVETQVLTGLGLSVGDEVKIGEAVFTISDELTAEPDRPLTAFGFGARVLMASSDLEATQLLGQRSRVSYRIELAGSPEQIEAEQARLAEVLASQPDVTMSDADSADTSVSRVSDNVLRFLKLLVIAVLFLSAVALLSVVKAFVDLGQRATAIRRALGESVGSIKHSYYRLFLLMAGLACAGSVLMSVVMLRFGGRYLSAVLPSDIVLSIQLLSVLKISLVAVTITLLIVQHSLYAVTHTKPSAVLKQANNSRRQRPPVYWYALVVLASFALLAFEFGSVLTGGQALLGMGLLAGGFWLLARGWLWLLTVIASHRQLGWLGRTAIHNLSRKGNQSGLFFVTLALSVAVLTMVTLLNHSLNSQFIQAYPQDAPNLFLLDVQSEQHDTLDKMIDAPLTYYPVIRARIIEAGGVPASEIESGTGDDPTRIFNLSYADSLMDTEFIAEAVVADQLFAPITEIGTKTKTDIEANNIDNASTTLPADTAVPMSILDTASEMLGVGLGDHVRFNIQGIEVVGQITSIRERYEKGPSPFFYFLFEPSVMADAPQIQFATARVDAESIPQLQTDIAHQFPAITSIDGGAIAKQIQTFVAQMSRLVQVFTLLALLTGMMVLITSLLSTSQDRLRDSASFRLLGMQTRDLYAINILEIGLLGISAGLIAMVGASITAWVLITQWFDLRFSVPWASFAMGGVALLAVLLIIAVSYVRLVIKKGIMARVRGMV